MVTYDFLSVTNSEVVAKMHSFQGRALWKSCDLGLTYWRQYTTSYLSLIVKVWLRCTVFNLQPLESPVTLVWPFKVAGVESSRRKVIYDFLSVTNSKGVAQMHCFQVTGLWKSCDLGVSFQGRQRSELRVPDWRQYMTSYLSLIVKVWLRCTVFKLQPLESPVTLVWAFKVTGGQSWEFQIEGNIWLPICN